MLKTVLVAVDQSDLAWEVIGSLEHLRLSPSCLVVLVQVLPPPIPGDYIPADVPGQEAGAEPVEADTWLERLSQEVDYPTAREIATGDAAEEIVRLAGIHRSELIVVGSRGLKGVERVIHGSVSSQVVADAPCAVLVVPHQG